MKKRLSLILLAALACPGCGDPEEGHAWKGQTDSLDKAAELENSVLESSMQQSRQIEDLAR